MIIAGEVSGDMHGAGLVSALKKRLPGTVFFGIGGDRMRAEGVEILHDVKDMAVMGFAEVVRRFGFFRRVFHEMVAVARDRKPDAVILVDYPGFNIEFAERTHELGIKVIYYICPQVWAWHRSRIPRMARVVDRLITIFPFEQKHFEGTGLKVDFAGHPFVDEARKELEKPLADLPWNGDPRVALLPGSRTHVIGQVLPAMWAAAALVEKSHPNAGFIIAAPSSAIESEIRSRLSEMPAGPSRWSIVAGNTRQVLRQARAAMIVSGTATVEASLMLCPMIIVYKMSWLTYLVSRMLVRVPRIGMVNIVAGKQVCPEFIQGNATPAALAAGIEPLLADSPARAAMAAELRKVTAALGPGGAVERAAGIVIEALGN